MINEAEKLMYTAMELKEYLGISTNATYHMLRENIIHSCKIGKKYLISKISIDRFLELNL